ncbi:MAG: hypothetical protein IPI65_17500 [Bacteroidetes bacterium]|nr:hypothetical protein [Bacteroidota bacterium]
MLPDLWKEPRYDWAICCWGRGKEYRGGVLIGTHYRDFQFNVTDCEPTAVANAPNVIEIVQIIP